MIRADLALLQRCPLFQSLPSAALADWFQRKALVSQSVEKGSLLRQRGDPYDELLVLLSGSLIAQMPSPDGKFLTVEVLQASEAIATSMLFAPRAVLPVNLLAAQESRVLAINRNLILELCREHEDFLRALLMDIGARTRFLAEKLRMTTFQHLRQKLAVYLVELAGQKKSEETPTLHMTHSRKQLAEVFGVARPSLSRSFAEFVHEGLLELDGDTVKLKDLEGLRRIARGISP